MKTQKALVVICLMLSIPVLLAGYPGKDKKKPKHDVCAEGNGQGAALVTCGSTTTPCEVDIKRTGGGDSASATPAVPSAKDNMPFQVKVGTTIVFKSTSKNTGFVLDFGNTSPFDSGTAIMGGADRPVSVVAKKAGCYTYSVGACVAGTIYGMCGEDAAQIVVSQ